MAESQGELMSCDSGENVGADCTHHAIDDAECEQSIKASTTTCGNGVMRILSERDGVQECAGEKMRDYQDIAGCCFVLDTIFRHAAILTEKENPAYPVAEVLLLMKGASDLMHAYGQKYREGNLEISAIKNSLALFIQKTAKSGVLALGDGDTEAFSEASSVMVLFYERHLAEIPPLGSTIFNAIQDSPEEFRDIGSAVYSKLLAIEDYYQRAVATFKTVTSADGNVYRVYPQDTALYVCLIYDELEGLSKFLKEKDSGGKFAPLAMALHTEMSHIEAGLQSLMMAKTPPLTSHTETHQESLSGDVSVILVSYLNIINQVNAEIARNLTKNPQKDLPLKFSPAEKLRLLRTELKKVRDSIQLLLEDSGKKEAAKTRARITPYQLKEILENLQNFRTWQNGMLSEKNLQCSLQNNQLLDIDNLISGLQRILSTEKNRITIQLRTMLNGALPLSCLSFISQMVHELNSMMEPHNKTLPPPRVDIQSGGEYLDLSI